MAITGRFRVSMQDVFPHGAFVVGEVEAVRDFERSTRQRVVQATDKERLQRRFRQRRGLVWQLCRQCGSGSFLPTHGDRLCGGCLSLR